MEAVHIPNTESKTQNDRELKTAKKGAANGPDKGNSHRCERGPVCAVIGQEWWVLFADGDDACDAVYCKNICTVHAN